MGATFRNRNVPEGEGTRGIAATAAGARSLQGWMVRVTCSASAPESTAITFPSYWIAELQKARKQTGLTNAEGHLPMGLATASTTRHLGREATSMPENGYKQAEGIADLYTRNPAPSCSGHPVHRSNAGIAATKLAVKFWLFHGSSCHTLSLETESSPLKGSTVVRQAHMRLGRPLQSCCCTAAAPPPKQAIFRNRNVPEWGGTLGE
jgi:hypothetical protein